MTEREDSVLPVGDQRVKRGGGANDGFRGLISSFENDRKTWAHSGSPTEPENVDDALDKPMEPQFFVIEASIGHQRRVCSKQPKEMLGLKSLEHPRSSKFVWMFLKEPSSRTFDEFPRKAKESFFEYNIDFTNTFSEKAAPRSTDVGIADAREFHPQFLSKLIQTPCLIGSRSF